MLHAAQERCHDFGLALFRTVRVRWTGIFGNHTCSSWNTQKSKQNKLAEFTRVETSASFIHFFYIINVICMGVIALTQKS